MEIPAAERDRLKNEATAALKEKVVPAYRGPGVDIGHRPSVIPGVPWDDELIRSSRRALSTHGRSRHRKLKPLRLARDPAARKAALERAALLA